MKSYYNYNQLIFVLFLAFTGYSCNNTNNKTALVDQNVKVIPSAQHDDNSEEDTGYSDSMINAMLVENEKRNQKIILDTSLILNQFTCTTALEGREITFDSDAPERFVNDLIELSKKEQMLLNSTHCFGKLNEAENYKLLVLFNNSIESHYSSSFQLISIIRGQDKIENLTLFQEYGNELGDEIITSKIDPSFNIIRTTIHNFRYIHGLGKVDSTHTLVEKYYVDENGYIKLS